MQTTTDAQTMTTETMRRYVAIARELRRRDAVTLDRFLRRVAANHGQRAADTVLAFSRGTPFVAVA